MTSVVEPSLPRSRGAGGRRMVAVLTASGRGFATLILALAALLAGVGWLYVLRSLGWLNVGPNVHDSLPLLQLAGFDVQPLGRVLAAFLAAGSIAGAALTRDPRVWRGVLLGTAALALLLLASQASFALTRNFRLSAVLWSRSPGAGPWLEGLVFAAGCALPGATRRLASRRRRSS